MMPQRILMTTFLLMLTGCTYSVHPLLTENELADDIDLSGTWHLEFPTPKAGAKKKYDPVTVTLDKWDKSTYDIMLGSNGDKLVDRKKHPQYPDMWKLQIGRIEGQLYAQVMPLDNLSGPPILSGIPVYTFGRIEIENDRIRFFGLQDNNSAVLAEKHKLPHITHSPSEEIDLTIFTESPEELQKMVKEHGNLLFKGGHSAMLTRVREQKEQSESRDSVNSNP